jgi:hypothetical protein
VNMKDAFEHLGRYLVFCYSRRPHMSLAERTPDAVYFENQRMVE